MSEKKHPFERAIKPIDTRRYPDRTRSSVIERLAKANKITASEREIVEEMMGRRHIFRALEELRERVGRGRAEPVYAYALARLRERDGDSIEIPYFFQM